MSDPFTLGGAALGSAKTAFDLMKAFVEVRDSAKVQEVRFELMGLLLQAQETEASLVAEKRRLEERIIQLETWEREKDRYELRQVSHGVFVRSLKKHATGGEPSHFICANCYERGKKRFLQSDGVPGPYGGIESLRCGECGEVLQIPHAGRPIPSQPEYDPFGELNR